MDPGTHWIGVDGGELLVSCRGGGPALLLLHGWPLDHRMFAPQFEGLAGDFTLIAPDRRGFGGSTAPPDMSLECEDVDRILDHLRVDRAHLLGMSQGGRIALRYAARRGDRLRSLVLQGAAVDGITVEAPEEERIPIDSFARLARAGELETLRRRWLAHPMMRLGPGQEELAGKLAEIMAAYDGADLLRPAQAIPDPGTDVLDALASFAAPTLILTGGKETQARKALADRLLALLPDAREVILEHSGHLSNLTEPAAYNDAVRSFCLAVESGAV